MVAAPEQVHMADGAAPSALLQALYSAPDEGACLKAADALAGFVQNDLRAAFVLHGVLDDLVRATKNQKSGFEREGGLVGLQTLFRRVGGRGGADAYFVPLFPVVLDRLQEVGKAAVVSEAADRAAKELCRLPPPQLIPRTLNFLFDYLEGSAKWRSKVGALEAIIKLCDRAKAQVADRLDLIIPRLTGQMRDSKPEVAAAAVKAAHAICAVLENPDVIPFVPLMVSCMARPDQVPEAIKKLSANVWVRDVDGPTLAVVVPLLVRGLADRGTLTLRSCCLLTSNLFKMVRSANLAAEHVPSILPGIERMAETAALPELRDHAVEAAKVLKAASVGGHAAAGEVDKQQADDEKQALEMLTSLIGKSIGTEVDPFCQTTLVWISAALASLVRERNYTEPEWLSTYLEPYFSRFLPQSIAEGIAREVRQRWLEIDRQRHAVDDVEEEAEEGEILTDIPFSLAYGGLLLLNHTKLRLVRGRRYGVCGPNGAGKSTLLKAINRHQIENFPEHLTTFYVEHDIDGVEDDITVRKFLLTDKFVTASGATVAQLDKILHETGFDSERQRMSVSALSGGWKMRLALARAMICQADILLLDEPTNHLDVKSVRWLEEYLVSQTDVTVLTVSHDSGFLDAVCTDIIHYELKRLVYYRGNLAKFVERHPEAQSYYVLDASALKFSFPPPGHLMGVRSNTRGILKMTDCTFTYPGSSKPSLYNVSCAVTLASRVGIVGPNGAGKSTLIKLLTGETIPDTGKVDKHPNLRVAYIAQHAFHHIEEHLEKTATQYIKWRYQDGTDRELAQKASRKMTEEERGILETPIKATTGEQRQIEMLIGRQKLKKSFTYEVKWKNMDHKYKCVGFKDHNQNRIEVGAKQFDDFEASREGSGSRELSGAAVRQTLEDLGLDGEIAEYNEMSGLSGGQKVKVVIAAALWAKPQVLILDEPTNFLDRTALGALAVAIREWAGAFVCISHNQEFVSALCPEIWSVEAGRLTHKGKVAIVEDAFGDSKPSSRQGSRAASRLGSASNSATPSATASRTNSGDEAAAAPANGLLDQGLPMPIVKKKKLTRKQLKERDERRRLRTIAWLSNSIPGAQREPDTDSD